MTSFLHIPLHFGAVKTKILSRTPFGPVALLWTLMDHRPRIARVLLSGPRGSAEEILHKEFPGIIAASCAEMENLAGRIESFLAGEDVHFPLDLADLGSCSEFQQAVLSAEHRIPRGCVSTYRLIAAHLHIPRGARAVGNALAGNPFPIIVPCHRAIRSDGHLGGYQGGTAMKRALLEKEGIALDDSERVVSPELYYGDIR